MCSREWQETDEPVEGPNCGSASAARYQPGCRASGERLGTRPAFFLLLGLAGKESRSMARHQGLAFVVRAKSLRAFRMPLSQFVLVRRFGSERSPQSALGPRCSRNFLAA